MQTRPHFRPKRGDCQSAGRVNPLPDVQKHRRAHFPFPGEPLRRSASPTAAAIPDKPADGSGAALTKLNHWPGSWPHHARHPRPAGRFGAGRGAIPAEPAVRRWQEENQSSVPGMRGGLTAQSVSGAAIPELAPAPEGQ